MKIKLNLLNIDAEVTQEKNEVVISIPDNIPFNENNIDLEKSFVDKNKWIITLS